MDDEERALLAQAAGAADGTAAAAAAAAGEPAAPPPLPPPAMGVDAAPELPDEVRWAVRSTSAGDHHQHHVNVTNCTHLMR
jgi:hypothetical protein